MAPRLGLAAMLWAARSQETVLIDHDGDMRQFTLYAGEAGCSAAFVARRFLEKEAKRGLWGDDDVATLAARVAVNDNGFAEGGRRCGWVHAWGERRFAVEDPDAVIRDLNVSYLDVGSAQSWWWSQPDSAHNLEGWLHIDEHYPVGSAENEAWTFVHTNASTGVSERVATYRGDALAFVRRLADESVSAVFTEHMVEHVTPAYLVKSLREWWRICRVGGAIRIVAPDLERSLRSYVAGDGFLAGSAYRGHFALPWEAEPSPGTLVNDLFRNWDHACGGWMWDFSSLLAAATAGAGIPERAVRRSSYRDATGLPAALHGREFRNESLFVTIVKTSDQLAPGVSEAALDATRDHYDCAAPP